MTEALLVAAALVLALGATFDLASRSRRGWRRTLPFAAGAAGSALATAAGVAMVLGPARTAELGSALGTGATSLRLDPLAGLFLTLVGGLGVAVSACLVSWCGPAGRVPARGTGASYLLLLAAAGGTILAGDAFTFLFGFEALTLASYLLVGSGGRSGRVRSAWATLGAGKLSGAALLLGLLLLAAQAHDGAFASWSRLPSGAGRDAAFALVVVGFAAKVGLVPFEVWIPLGYPGAPGPVRAALAGVAANVGFYGLWRFLGLLGPPPAWLAVALLVLGGTSALLGSAFASVQSRLDRTIAYSSVENAGLITVGYGVALAGGATRNVEVVAAGLVAATLQVLAHGVAKSSLFASAAFFEADFGTEELESLRGIHRSHPVSAAAFSLGSVTLAGLPPTIGFVSEWFILEALLQQFRIHDLALRLAMALAAALVALSVGVALLCFARLLGLVVLGRHDRRRRASPPLDGGAAGRGGLLLLASACLGLAAAAPWVLRFVADGLAPVVPRTVVLRALKTPWVIQPVVSGFSSLSPSWLALVLPAGFAAVSLVALALSRGSLARPRRVPAWRSATPGVAGPTGYGAFGYANILRYVLANVLGPRHTVAASTDALEPAGAAGSAHLEVRTDLVEPVEAHLYRPAHAAWLRLAAAATRLQSGHLFAYVGYLLGVLCTLIAIVAAMR
ncbi:MAG TPA: proton-conducting transporter membrane subunit [Acidimicrobiales bacterium]|nr:proton-conducting transporter membrane subunit [Acidimicrobiales bacterium]